MSELLRTMWKLLSQWIAIALAFAAIAILEAVRLHWWPVLTIVAAVGTLIGLCAAVGAWRRTR